MIYGLWFMVYGSWLMVYGVWFMVYGLWFMLLPGVEGLGQGTVHIEPPVTHKILQEDQVIPLAIMSENDAKGGWVG